MVKSNRGDDRINRSGTGFRIPGQTFNCNQSLATEIEMDALTEQLEMKLQEWKPEISERVRQHILEPDVSTDNQSNPTEP
jgi:hypothetical protein